MLILVEGVDGSGKTTLCNQLKEKGLTIEQPINRLEEFPHYRWFELSQRRDVSVLDRSFITELVYRTVDDKAAGKMTLGEMCSILRFCKIILCETDTCFEDSMLRGEDNITCKETSLQIKQTYRTIITMLNKFNSVQTFIYDWKHQTVNDVLKFIQK